MDSFKKKITPRQNQADRKTVQPNAAHLSQTAFRQIQQQFSKNRTNNDKVMQSLERINAASLEKNIKTERVLTQQSFDQQSVIELYSSPTSQTHQLVAATSASNNDEKGWRGARPARQKIVSELAFGNTSKVSSRKPTTQLNRTVVLDTAGMQMTEPDQELAELRSNIHQQYKRKLYDHEVYIKELLRESAELNEAWGRSREMLHQTRLEKEALDREMRKDREEYSLLKQVLIKENQYYKCQLRISQRETAQLRERLNKMAGLRSAADQMQEISEDEHTEEEEQIVEKLQHLDQTIKQYSERLYKARQYELQIEDLTASKTAISLKLEGTQRELSQLEQVLEIRKKDEADKSQCVRIELQQQTARLTEANELLKDRSTEIGTLQESMKQLSEELALQVGLIAGLEQQKTDIIAENNRLATDASTKHQTIQRLEHELEKLSNEIQAKMASSDQHINTLKEQHQQQRQKAESHTTALKEEHAKINKQYQQLVAEQESLKQRLKEVTEATLARQHIAQVQRVVIECDTQTVNTILSTCVTLNETCQPVATSTKLVSVETFTEDVITTEPSKNQQPDQSELIELRRNNQELQHELSLTMEQLTKTRQHIEALSVRQKEIVKQLEVCASTKDESEEHTSKQVTAMLQKIEALEEELEKCGYSKESTEKKYDLIAEEFERFRSQYDSLTEAHEDLESKFERLQAESAEKEQQIEQLAHQLKRSQEHNQELSHLQPRECEQCKRMERQINRLDSELRSTKYGYEDRIIKIEDENESLKNTVTRIRAFSKEAF